MRTQRSQHSQTAWPNTSVAPGAPTSTCRISPLRHGANVFALLIGCVLPRETHAQLPADCERLGKALVEHSCFHSELGPFEHRIPTRGAEPSGSTPNVDAVHTEYRLMLAPGENTVTYEPQRTGSFSVFTGWDVPMSVIGEEGTVPEILRSEETGCDALPLSRVFELRAQEVYVLTFEATDADEVVLVIEYIDDFSIKNGRDQDGDGYGDPAATVTTSCVPPVGYAPNTGDCDDTNPLVHPAASELCGDAVDQNCNGLPDDTGFSCQVGTGACLVKGTTVCNANGETSCEAALVEGTKEECNGRDDDCDGEIDEEDDLCPDAGAPRCVRSQLAASCGCQFDSDCTVSGEDFVCDAGICKVPKSQEPDDGMGGVPNDGSGGRTDQGPSGGPGSNDDDQDGSETSGRDADTSETAHGSCGCRTHGGSPWSGGSITALSLGVGWLLRRRGRRLSHTQGASA